MFWRRGRKWGRVFILAVIYFYAVILLHARRRSLDEEKSLNDDIQGSEPVSMNILLKRNQQLQSHCERHPPPFATFQKKARDAAPDSQKLAEYFQQLHFKELSKRIIHLDRKKLTWCMVPKVASTSFSRALLHMRGVSDDQILAHKHSLQVLLKDKVRPVPTDQSFSDALSFFFVRHPFARIVSAFRNKLEDSTAGDDGNYFYKMYGRKIVQRFRIILIQDSLHRAPNGDSVNNEKSINSIASDDGKYGGGRKSKGIGKQEFGGKYEVSKPRSDNSGKEPTFEEFIEYLIYTDINEYDEHWRPVWLQCGVCDLNYKLFIKYENFNNEINTLLDYMKSVESVPKRFNLNKENSGRTDDNIVKEYFGKISSEKKIKLFEKYKHDFIYFNYDIKEFL